MFGLFLRCLISGVHVPGGFRLPSVGWLGVVGCLFVGLLFGARVSWRRPFPPLGFTPPLGHMPGWLVRVRFLPFWPAPLPLRFIAARHFLRWWFRRVPAFSLS